MISQNISGAFPLENHKGMNQNRWIALKRAIPWRKLDKKTQPILASQRLPLSPKTLLRSIMVQQLDDLSDLQLGKLLPEHHHYRVFVETKSQGFLARCMAGEMVAMSGSVGRPSLDRAGVCCYGNHSPVATIRYGGFYAGSRCTH